MEDYEEAAKPFRGHIDTFNSTTVIDEGQSLETQYYLTAVLAGSLLLILVVALMFLTVFRDKNPENSENIESGGRRCRNRTVASTEPINDKPPSYEEFTKHYQDSSLPTYEEAVHQRDSLVQPVAQTPSVSSSISECSSHQGSHVPLHSPRPDNNVFVIRLEESDHQTFVGT